jgi:hypothetical protein
MIPMAGSARGFSETRLRLDALTAWCHRLARHAPPATAQLPPDAEARLAAAGAAVAGAARRTGLLIGGIPGPAPAPAVPDDGPLEPDESNVWVHERLHLLGQVGNALRLVRRQYEPAVESRIEPVPG